MALFITSREVGQLLGIDDYLVSLEKAYAQLGRGVSNMLPRIKVDAASRAGFMKILPASLSEAGVAGLHVYTGGGQGDFLKAIFLFDIPSGNLEAIIEADRLGWLVPGAVSALATKYLARKEASIMALFGAGRQAQAQLLAISRVRPLQLVKVYSPQKGHRESFCEEMGKTLGLNVLPVDSPREAISGAQIISTATSTKTPVFDGEAVEPGTHINAIGAHDPRRREVDGRCVQRSKVVADSLERALQEEGALLLAAREGAIELPHVYGELGEIVAGRKAGRRDGKEITLFLSGATAIEYVAVGDEVYRRALAQGMGQQLTLQRDEAVPRSLGTKAR